MLTVSTPSTERLLLLMSVWGGLRTCVMVCCGVTIVARKRWNRSGRQGLIWAGGGGAVPRLPGSLRGGGASGGPCRAAMHAFVALISACVIGAMAWSMLIVWPPV